MYDEHELVVLTRDIPADGLVSGDVGAVVGVYGEGGYEVEFVAGDGRTIAVATLEESDLRPCDESAIKPVD